MFAKASSIFIPTTVGLLVLTGWLVITRNQIADTAANPITDPAQAMAVFWLFSAMGFGAGVIFAVAAAIVVYKLSR